MRHFIIVAHLFWNDRGIGSKRWREMAPLLREHGQVTVISADAPGATAGDTQVVCVPDQRNTAPMRNGFAARPPNNPIVRRARHWAQSFLFWPDRQKKWARAAVSRLNGVLRAEAENIIITSGPRFSIHTEMCRWLKSNRTNAFWIMDLRDPWTNDPAPAMKRRSPAFLTRIEARMEAACHRQADLVTTIGDTMTSMMKRDFASPAVTIYNGYAEEDLNNDSPPGKGKPDATLRVCYLGSIIHGMRSPQLLFQAARALEEKAGRLSFEFWCNDPGFVRREAALHSVANRVTCHPAVSLLESRQIQREADANLILNDTAPTANHILTGKVFELIAAQRPLIAISGPESELRTIVEQCGSNGVVWDSESARNVLIRLLTGQLRAVADPARRFSRRAAVETLIEAIHHSARHPALHTV